MKMSFTNMTATKRAPLPPFCRSILAGLLLLIAATGAADNSRQALDDIRATAEAFVLARLGGNANGTTASAGQLDPRLRLARCQQALVAFAVAGDRLKGNTSVGVQCPGSWRLYVPVKVETLRPVLALRHSLDRGKILGPDDLEFVTVDTDRLVRGYYADMASVTGHTLKRSAAGGTILTHTLVQEPPVIQRGQRVSLVSSGSGIAVQAPGEALADARIGDRLHVRNLSSGKTVQGIARSSGTVEVY
ncbi:flagella basal body P-ring formation protein FlgA [Chromatocurvus halotolerans]|uniref:Flagella basal body P-ring formation protein FlgA n=2 Tax=Chromatocurvus halotolerans TaxID=1132028 RepID=A0A4R2LBF2_9GAMM|nr:flagella basal body P-ring formation protein FlgA [Chromatocurvus halotolerans]